ncbi:MAG: alpha/beta hydrolase fold domain-containing protein [Oscillospiraceae bacterium]
MKNKRLDLRYGSEHPRQVFDIYYPEEGDGPWPVLLHMHGGGFALGDKRDFHIKELLDAVHHGYVFASCNYRRSGDAPFPAAVLDCRKFLKYLKDNAAELNILPDKICAYGGSSGGNLSAMFAMNIPQFEGETEPVDASVACAIDWFGPTDFAKMDEQARENGISIADHNEPQSPESKYAGGPLPELDPAWLDKMNPMTYINDGMAPMLIQHGRMDVLVPFRQSEILVEAIEKKLGRGRAIFLPLDTAGHDDPQFKSPENLAILWAFMDQHLKGIEPETPIEEMPLPAGETAGSTQAFGLPPMGMPPMGMPPMGGKPPFDGPPPMDGKPPLGGPPELDGAPPLVPIPALSQEILDGIREKYLDIPYCGASESQKLDLYLPNERDGKPMPVIVHFHGGAFMICSKRDDSVEPMLRGLDRGYAVVSAEYRKSGEARYPAMVYDAKAVIRWVRANAEKYHLDTEHIAVWGPSSGGWLSSYVAVTNDNPAFEDLSMGNAAYSSRVHACVDWCGPCAGFLAMDEAFKKSGTGIPDHDGAMSPESQFLGAPITSVPELVQLASPIAHVHAETVPFLILHGSGDQVVPVEQSKAFYDALTQAGADARLHIAEGKPHHGDPWYHEAWVSELCLDFLDEVFERK